MDFKKTLNFITKLRKESKFKNLTSIVIAEKIKNGINTGKLCIRFTFTKKLPLSELQLEEIVPKELFLDNEIIITDVMEMPVSFHLASDCFTGPNDYNPPEPIISNRKKYRPLQGGISSISIKGTDATLGLIVTDKSTGKPVCLSNSHVYAEARTHDKYYNASLQKYPVPQALPTQFPTTLCSDLCARQPSSNDYTPYGSSDASVDYLGNCIRSVVIGDKDYRIGNDGFIIESSCDAAIVAPLSTSLVDPLTSFKILGLDYDKPITFATDNEIFSMLDSSSPSYKAPVFKSGRTTGPIGFPGNNYSCSTYIDAIGDTTVGYYGNYFISWFTYCMIVSSSNDIVPTRGGDSGSALLGLFNKNNPSLSAWKCIGLIFAGPGGANPSYGIGCSITNVAAELDIVPYNPSLPFKESEKSFLNIETQRFTDNDWLSAGTITLSGRKYFLNGRYV